MAFLEESLFIEVFPHRVDGWEVWVGMRAGFLGWGAGIWGQDLRTIGTRICAGSDTSLLCLHPQPFPNQRVLHIGQDPVGEASATSVQSPQDC